MTDLTTEEFISAGAAHLLAHLVDVDLKRARLVMADAVSQFLEDEQLDYGNPAYVWDADAARTLAQEYVLDHAEAVAD